MATVTRTKHYIIYVSLNASSNASTCTSDGAGYADASSDACHADFLLFLFSERKALKISWLKPEYISSRVLLW